jgi:DNA repair protein RadC
MSKINKIKHMKPSEKPREKLEKQGPSKLKNHELLAIILGRGSKKEDVLALARRIIDDYGEKPLSYERDVKKFSEGLNLTKIQACQVIAALELGRRFFGKARRDVFLNSPREVYSYLAGSGRLEKEVMHGLYVDVKNKLLKDITISIGTLTFSVAHAREVFKSAIQYSAAGVILVHNHPSGDPSPSKEDIDLTKQLKKVSEIIDIELLDHVIIGKETYCSMKSEGLL